MPFLENFVHGNQRFERLYFISEDGLPVVEERSC